MFIPRPQDLGARRYAKASSRTVSHSEYEDDWCFRNGPPLHSKRATAWVLAAVGFAAALGWYIDHSRCGLPTAAQTETSVG